MEQRMWKRESLSCRHLGDPTVYPASSKAAPLFEGELHSIELRLKSQKKRGKKMTAAVYEYLADCGGKWGELSYNFKDNTAEVLLLAEWDTMVSRRFTMRAVEYLKAHQNDELPDSIILTFIGPEQIEIQTTQKVHITIYIDQTHGYNKIKEMNFPLKIVFAPR